MIRQEKHYMNLCRAIVHEQTHIIEHIKEHVEDPAPHSREVMARAEYERNTFA